MFAIAGCNVSFKWSLGNKSVKAIHALVYHSSNKSADLAHGECTVMDKASTFCNTSKDGDEWTLYLTIFNVTEAKSGKYTLQIRLENMSMVNSSKELQVIGKPTVMTLRKSILNQPFQIACNSSFTFNCFLYKWKIDGVDIPVRNVHKYDISSLRTIDNMKRVTCQICLNKTANQLGNEICKNDGCTDDSESYSIEIIYGPDNVSLSLKERHFYIKLFESFTIYCMASCNPPCIFRWIGHDTINGEKLAITSFEPRMAGQYTCYVTNQQTNTTSSADPIIIHHDKGTSLMQYWIGPVIVSALLLFFGVLNFATRRRTERIREVVRYHQSCRRQNDSEISPAEVGVSNRFQSYREERNHVVRTNKKIKRDDCLRLWHRKSISEQDERKDNCEETLREDPYSAIDDDAISVQDCMIENYSQQTGRVTEHALYDYACSDETDKAENRTLHVTDKTYLTLIGDIYPASGILQEESYITAISDVPDPNEYRENLEADSLQTTKDTLPE